MPRKPPLLGACPEPATILRNVNVNGERNSTSYMCSFLESEVVVALNSPKFIGLGINDNNNKFRRLTRTFLPRVLTQACSRVILREVYTVVFRIPSRRALSLPCDEELDSLGLSWNGQEQQSDKNARVLGLS